MLVGVIADFSIEVDGARFLREPEFPVLELARALRDWLDDFERGSVHDFSYNSMEADEAVLEFRRRDGGWSMRSPFQEFEIQRALTADEVHIAAKEFVGAAKRDASALGLGDRWLVDGR